MEALFPGRFASFEDMKPGDVFAFPGKSGSPHFAMKVHYAEADGGAGRACVVRFNRPGISKAKVEVMLNNNITREHTLMVLDNLAIAPANALAFQGVLELQGNPIEAGWLGVDGNDAILTCMAEHPPALRLGFINLASGVLSERGRIGGWFPHWQIAQITPEGRSILFEARSSTISQSEVHV